MTAIQCVVFDIDDTLYLERDYVRSGFDAVGAALERELGVVGFAANAWAAFERGTRRRIFDEALVGCGVPASAELVARLVATYREHRPTIALLEDSRACIDALRSTVALAALTDGPLASQRAKATALGISSNMSPIVFTEELGPGRGKPDPEGFRRIESAVGSRGATNLYVADNPAKDFAGPRQLGWTTVRVIRPGGLHAAAPSGADVDNEITDLRELPAVLRGQ